eukprot:jgi/Ulvmu1/2626/UM014_0078.1
MNAEWECQELSVQRTEARVFLDENAELLYVFKVGSISAYSLPMSGSGGSSLVWTVRCPEGLSDPANDCISLSVPTASTSDSVTSRPTILSILQGNDVIHFFDIQTGQSFIQTVPPPTGRLRCFMWTSCPAAQFVIVTSLGLQCYSLRKQALYSSKQSKALQEAANANLSGIMWAKYQHHSRLLVQATEFDLVVMQITGQRGITRLRHFSLSKLYGSVATAGAVRPEHVAIVRSQQLSSADTGTRMYICAIDAAREAIRVLSLSATEVTYLGDLEWPAKQESQQSCLSLRSADLAFSVIDNMVVMHCLPLGTATLFDFLLQPSMPADGSHVPLFDPVAVIQYADPASSSSSSSRAAAPPAGARYLPPCHAIDMSSLSLYRFKVNMQACLSETALPPGKHFLSLSERGSVEWLWLREQQIAALRRFLQASPSLEYATKVFDNLNSRFAAHARRSSDIASLRVLKPSDIVNEVLLWLHKGREAEPARLEAYISSFGVSARRYSIVLPPAHGALLLQCIVGQGKELQAGLVLRGMAPAWSRPAMVYALQAQAESGALQVAWVWCARLWARVTMNQGASGTARPSAAGQPAVKAEAVDGYVRCLLECNDISGAAIGLRDSLGPRNDAAAQAVVARAEEFDPLVHAAVCRCCAVPTPAPCS